MKRFFVVGLFCLIVLAIATRFYPVFFPETPSPDPQPSPVPSGEHTHAEAQHIHITRNEIQYTVYYAYLTDRSILLIPNFDNSRAAQVVAAENNCVVASSGGYYTVDRKPLGLFTVNGSTISKRSSDTSLLNGYFYIDASGNSHIGTSVPANIPTAFQSGPLFTSGDKYPTRVDEEARRIVAIETTTGDLLIAAIVRENNAFSGPFLSDVPSLVFSIDEPFHATRALNLDGGSASFYKDGAEFALPELVHVGSIICVK